MDKFNREILIDLLKTMESLKDDKDREKFCINFDEEYEKLKKKLED